METFRAGGLSPDEIPAVLVANHGPFTWGPDAVAAVERAEVLEYLAQIEIGLRAIAPGAERPADHLVERHYRRKHGPKAYYGQRQP